MVHSALKLKTFTEKYHSSPVPRETSRDTVLSLSETTSSSTVPRSTPPVHSPPTHLPPPIIRFLLEMMTPNEFATILRARVARLISQWSQYASQPPTFLRHGLPSPSSSGSPLVQNQTGKRMDLAMIHSFVAFFYPEEHQIHQSGDITPDTLLAHLEGLQTLLSFLSSRELRVIIKNRLSSSSSHRSASIQAVVEVMRNMLVEDEENEESDSTWKQLWLKTTPIPSAPTDRPMKTKTFVDVAVATEHVLPTAMARTSVANIPAMRPSPSDGSRPPKRPKYMASHPMFQDPTDDFRAGSSLPPLNSANDGVHDQSHVSGSTSISIPLPKMADPILRPVSTRSFKSPPITSVLDDDGEADAEGDTDTDIDMDVDLAVDLNEHGDDSKDLTIAQVINSCRSEEAAVNTFTTTHSLSNGSIGLQTSSENPAVSVAPASVATIASSSTSVNLPDTSKISNNRHGDIPKGPRAMRSLLSNESIYPISSGSRTPSIPTVNSLSRISPPNTITTSAAMMPITLQAKQALLSSEWGLTKTTELKENGTRQFPFEINDQTSDSQLHLKEPTLRRIGPPTKLTGPPAKKLQDFPHPLSPTQPVFTALRGPPLPPSPASSFISSILKSTNTTLLRYEGPELPPYEEVISSDVLPNSTPDAGNTTSISIQSRSKPSRRDKKSAVSPSRFSGRSQKSISRSRTSSPSKSRSRSADEKRHRLPKKKSLSMKYDTQSSTRNSIKHSHSQSDKRAWDSSSRSCSRSTSRSRSESRPRIPYRPRNYSYSRPPSPSSSKDRHWSPEPSRRRERGRSRSRRRRGDENPSTSRTSNVMDHWSPGRDSRRGDDISRTDTTIRSSNVKSRSGRA